MIQTRSNTNDPAIERVFLDACVLYSAALGGPGSSKLWGLEGIALVTNEYALVEAYQNLANRNDPAVLAQLEVLIRSVEVVAYAPSAEELQEGGAWGLPDEHDIPIMIGATGSGCSALVTLDSACFGRWFGRELGGVLVLKPGKLLARFGR